MKIIIAIIIFSAIVLFHEFGHYIVAKKCDVQVNEFMLGLGPKLIGIQGKETLFSIHLLPFGGACVMEGEDSSSDNPRAFPNKSVWQRFLIVAAGPFFNFILAYVLAVVLVACAGYAPAIITETMEGYPAEEAGIIAGDEILSINGHSIHFYQEVSTYIMLHTGEELTLVLNRGGEEIETTLVPRYDEETKRYYIGITSTASRVKTGVFGTLSKAFWQVRYMIYTTIESLRYLISGQLSITELSGPVGIVQTIGEVYEDSIAISIYVAFIEMLNLTILLSANLGVMNLLPFPALDGGRLVFFIVEMIRRKKAPEKVENFVNLAGFAILMVFMVMVMMVDFQRILG